MYLDFLLGLTTGAAVIAMILYLFMIAMIAIHHVSCTHGHAVVFAWEYSSTRYEYISFIP